MNISTVQKRKFLNNIYKLFYSTGKTPTEFEVRNAFNQYFQVNKPGYPAIIDYNSLATESIANPDTINELMINTILNLEVLFDCVTETNEEIFNVVHTINDKIENLRARRKELESKIDQLTFANANSDGFFYSFLDNFSTLNNIDLNITSAFVDLVNNNVSLPKITSLYSNQNNLSQLSLAGITNTVTFDGRVVAERQNVTDFDATFDGLNDTYWNYDLSTESIGVASITLSIPIGGVIGVSKVSGSLMSKSPCSVYLKAIPSSVSEQPVIVTKNSTEDYNRFSFIIPSQNYSNIQLTIYKTEPDSVIRSATKPYLYSFGIRDLVIGSDYHDTEASIVSKPIAIPTADNKLLAISSVALDVKQQIVSGTNITYYVAADNPDGENINDFDWIPIEVNEFDSSAESKSINLTSSPYKTIYIDRDYFNDGLKLIPINENATNSNELNPIALPYTGRSAYRVTSVGSTREYLQPYILSSLNCYRHYSLYNDNAKVDLQLYKSLTQWSSYIADTTNLSINRDVLSNLDSLINITINSPSVGFLDTKILAEDIKTGSHIISKSRDDINLSVYLNGVLIADIPSGQKDAKVDWEFIKGVNNLSILYDKNFVGSVSIDLMQGVKLSDYGIIFLDYFNYLDPIEFSMRTSSDINAFTIDTIFGSREVLASKEISNKSIFRYYSSQSELITAVRYRADLLRFNNPNQTPILDGVRVKFKHSDM
jgi:hypothetical protein